MRKGKWGFTTSGRHLLLAFAGLFAFAALWWFYEPSYLDIYVPIPSYHGDIWDRTSRTVSYTKNRPGREYVLRREGTAYNSAVGWQTASDGFSYFDRWLGERGWQRTEMYTGGDDALPESKCLKFGQTFAVYTRPEDTSGFAGSNKGATGRVTVAIWPVSGWSEPQARDSTGFNVVMVTTRPSIWRQIHDAFDD